MYMYAVCTSTYYFGLIARFPHNLFASNIYINCMQFLRNPWSNGARGILVFVNNNVFVVSVFGGIRLLILVVLMLFFRLSVLV